MIVNKNIKFSVIPDKVIDRMIQVIDGGAPADLARDLKVSVNNFSNWKTDGVSLRMVFRFSKKHRVSLDWLLFGKQPLEDERSGEWIGLEGLSRHQRNLISVIHQDRLLADTIMRLYKIVVSRISDHREVIEDGIDFPVKGTIPEMVIADNIQSKER